MRGPSIDLQVHAETGRTAHTERRARAAILAALARDGTVVAARLVDELGVSEDTVRRDLRELASRGLVQRVHGGALPPAPRPVGFARRSVSATAERTALARAAVDLVAGARVLMLDGSTTNLELARLLPGGHVGSVITNSPPIAVALAAHRDIDVVVIGGRLDTHAQATLGSSAVDFIRTIRADACVLGACTLHPDAGLATDGLEEADVERAMAESAGDVIVLATADTLRAAGPYLVAPVRQVTRIVAGPDAPEDLLVEYRALGPAVIRA